MNEEVRRECHRLGISKQEFVRSLVKDFFLRVHGRDIVLEGREKSTQFVTEDQL